MMALSIGALDWLLLHYSHGTGELAIVWVGNALLTAWLLARPTSLWRGYIAAGFVAEVAARALDGSTLPHALALGLADVAEVLIVAISIRKRVPDIGEPQHWLTLGGIATVSTLAACAVSALVAAGANVLLADGRFLQSLLGWYAAHVLGMVVFGTATLVLHRRGHRLLAATTWRGAFVFDMLLVAAVSATVFSLRLPLTFLAYPPLLLAAFRHGFPGVAVGMLLFGTISSVATSLGRGPIAWVEGPAAIALLQLYIAGACLMTIPVALVMAERHRLAARMRESELRYRMLADYSHDVIVRMRADGEHLYVSPSARDILGWSPAEMLGKRWDLIHPEDRELQQQQMREVLAGGQPTTAVYRMRHRDGHYVWIEAVIRPIPSIDDQGMDIIYTGRDVSRRVAAEAALEASRRELERMARIDALTGLANRRQFEERLELSLARLRRHGGPIALMYLDVDHFKQINDTWGHAAGDRVLSTFARRLADCVRATDLVARMGGDEFVVIVEDAVLPEAAETVARKLIAEMRQGIDIGPTALLATTSIGITCTDAPVDAETLLAAADAALYAAKQAGRNTWRVRLVDPETGRGDSRSVRG